MKSKKTGTITAWALAAVGALILICSRFVVVEAVYPVERARQAVSRGLLSRLAGMFRAGSVQAENRRLKSQVEELSLLKGDIVRLEEENGRLRRALDYVARKPEQWLAAGVLSRQGGAAGVHRTIRVDKGTAAGVVKGAVVVVPEGLVGRVTAVTLHTSEIALVTDPSVKVSCEIVTGRPGGVRGILCGGSEDRLLIRYLRDDDGASVHSRVLTSGCGGVFPRGIEVGTLLSVTNRIRSVEGEVLPSVDYSTLEDVFIRRAK